MGTWKILINGTDTFVPVFNRLWEIAQELVPYFIFIALWSLAIYFVRWAVKAIMDYLKYKSEWPFAFRKWSRRNPKVKYDRKQHNYDEMHGKLKDEREYYR